jgi:hypothetical protein
MSRSSRLTIAGGSVLLSISVIALVTVAFTPSEQQTIKNMKQRMTRIEATAAADKAAFQAEVDEQAQLICQLEHAIDGITGDLSVINENQVILSSDIDIIDAGLSGLVADDGPIAQIDRNLKATQDIVFAAHPPIAITDVVTSSTCTTTSCTAVIEWKSAPPATGQVEWGLTEAYGNQTAKAFTLTSALWFAFATTFGMIAAGYLVAPWGALLGERSPADSGWALATQGFIAAVLQGKGYPMLAFLFGMGLVLALGRRRFGAQSHMRALNPAYA